MLKEQEILVKENEVEETEEIVVDECMNCRSRLILVVEKELEFDGKTTKHSGYVCSDCGCFHYMDGEDVVYEYTYSDGRNKDVKWNINSN